MRRVETVGNTVGLDDVIEALGQQRGGLQIGDGVVESSLRDVSVTSARRSGVGRAGTSGAPSRDVASGVAVVSVSAALSAARVPSSVGEPPQAASDRVSKQAKDRIVVCLSSGGDLQATWHGKSAGPRVTCVGGAAPGALEEALSSVRRLISSDAGS
jgi:hypothetical protein